MASLEHVEKINQSFLDTLKLSSSTISLPIDLFFRHSVLKVTPPPHRIFLKRAIFEKLILLNLLVQIYTKITKNVYFEIMTNETPFLRNENFLGLKITGLGILKIVTFLILN